MPSGADEAAGVALRLGRADRPGEVAAVLDGGQPEPEELVQVAVLAAVDDVVGVDGRVVVADRVARRLR